MRPNQSFFFRLLLAFILTGVDVQDVPSLQELCPYTSFCTSGPLKVLRSKARPCCLPCSCSDKCVLTGNCCPDKPHFPNKTIQHFPDEAYSGKTIMPCRHQASLYSKLLNRTFFAFVTSNYRVIDRCPGELRNSSSIVEDAQSACYKAQHIDDIIFVSDADTFELYLNHHCARCNGVKHTLVWPLTIRGGNFDISLAKSNEERDEYIFKKCSAFSTPPSTDIAMHSLCYPDSKDTCDESASFELKALCSDTTDYGYTLIRPFLNQVYKNVYCYLCDSTVYDNMTEKCPLIDIAEGKDYFAPIARLLYLVDFQRRLPAADFEHEPCSKSKILDPFLVNTMYISLICFEISYVMKKCSDVVTMHTYAIIINNQFKIRVMHKSIIFSPGAI